jgi:hypothetical protein
MEKGLFLTARSALGETSSACLNVLRTGAISAAEGYKVAMIIPSQGMAAE